MARSKVALYDWPRISFAKVAFDASETISRGFSNKIHQHLSQSQALSSLYFSWEIRDTVEIIGTDYPDRFLWLSQRETIDDGNSFNRREH